MSASETAPAVQHPGETPGAQYMEAVLSQLGVDIGERFAGSDAEHRAADAIIAAFEHVGLTARKQGFPFLGWNLTGEPTLVLEGSTRTVVDTAPVIFSGPTGTEGACGRLVRWRKKILIAGLYEPDLYAIVDHAGDAIAQVVVGDAERAIGLLNPDQRFQLPTLVVGSRDGHLLATAAEEQASATATIACEILPHAYSENVVAAYRGNPSAETKIVVDAHYDTQLNTPGCYDNASGVAAMIGVASKVVQAHPAVNIDFVAVAGEEIGMFGSSYLADRMAESGELESVDACICLDQVSAGDTLWLWASEELREATIDSATKAGLTELGDLRVDAPMPGCDMWPFVAHDVPGALFMWWRLPDYHRPTDTLEKVDMRKVERSAEAAYILINDKFVTP